MKKNGYTFLEIAVPAAVSVALISAVVVYLLTHSNNAKFKPMYIKSMATLSQVPIMSKYNTETDFSDILNKCSEKISEIKEENKNSGSLCGMLNSTLADYTIIGTVSDIKYKHNERMHSYSVITDKLPADYKDYIVYTLSDGSYVAINREARNCELPIAVSIYDKQLNSLYKKDEIDLNKCIGFIDVNGPLPPNREAYCTTGENSFDNSSSCYVDMRQNKISDIYPIIFYNSQVEPLTTAAKTAYLESRAK